MSALQNLQDLCNLIGILHFLHSFVFLVISIYLIYYFVWRLPMLTRSLILLVARFGSHIMIEMAPPPPRGSILLNIIHMINFRAPKNPLHRSAVMATRWLKSINMLSTHSSF